MRNVEITDAEAEHLLERQIAWFADILDDASSYFAEESVSSARADLAMQLDLLARFGCSLDRFIETVNHATAWKLEIMAECLGCANAEEMNLVGTYVLFLSNIIS